MRTKLLVIGQFLSLCVFILLGFLPWLAVCSFAGWIASAFGPQAEMVAFYAWTALYIWVAASVVRRWNEARRLVGLSPENWRRYLVTAWSLPLGLTAGLAIFAGLLLWGWQILFWLKTDQWVPLDFVSLMTPLDSEPVGPRRLFVDIMMGHDWIVAPTDWYGLQKVAHFVLSLLTPPLVFLGFGVGIADKSFNYAEARRRILKGQP